MSEYVKQSGNGCIAGKHYTIVTPASLKEEHLAKEILENFHAAFHGTPKQNPEFLDTGDDDDEFSLNAKKAKVKADKGTKQDEEMLNTYLELKIKRERDQSSERFDDDNADVRVYSRKRNWKRN